MSAVRRAALSGIWFRRTYSKCNMFTQDTPAGRRRLRLSAGARFVRYSSQNLHSEHRLFAASPERQGNALRTPADSSARRWADGKRRVSLTRMSGIPFRRPSRAMCRTRASAGISEIASDRASFPIPRFRTGSIRPIFTSSVIYTTRNPGIVHPPRRPLKNLDFTSSEDVQ